MAPRLLGAESRLGGGVVGTGAANASAKALAMAASFAVDSICTPQAAQPALGPMGPMGMGLEGAAATLSTGVATTAGDANVGDAIRDAGGVLGDDGRAVACIRGAGPKTKLSPGAIDLEGSVAALSTGPVASLTEGGGGVTTSESTAGRVAIGGAGDVADASSGSVVPS